MQLRLADLGNPRNSILTEKGLESKKWLQAYIGSGFKDNLSGFLTRGWICFLYGIDNRLMIGHPKENS